ncbi:medium-chain acyl-CoA ligase ACSF2, mitochondrial [Nematostella vectensis]|uniref:medium-chain acyl-CoA ligase ACSF2, mitochondrial n=1 Tax=Nematostella vectensis TaxID=45351 RepID=UPI00139015FA|nr:medium-chain acyl-CoA ligase ACSF2, mitochondrial [Nematostella vectensis]XP_032241890.2 medium-chain acyl-CoA ligase ACSF2, mitochondrial [Nematostella vectensis]XP_048587316.1 medium-chain acyl-CoA ligase ACSF2, mitochondrial [Nematostella vectensis]
MSAGQSYYHKPRSQLLDNRLLHDLLDWQAANHPTDDALVHYDENKHRHNLSYATYRTQSRDLAAGLRNLGFSTADRLLIIAPNGLQYCVAMMAVSRIGACAVLMSTSGRRELDRFTAELLRKWGIKGVLCDIGTNMKLLNGLRMLAPHLHAIVYRGTQPSVHGCAIHSYDWLIETGKSLTTSDVYHDAKDPMFVVLTSGTSGPCKASVISSYALINGHNLDTQGPQGPRNLALFNYKPMSVSSFLPIFALALIRGYRVVSVPHTLGCGRLEWVLSVIAAEGCATCSLPLNLVEDLVNRPSLVAKFPLPRITTFGFGGQFVPRKLIVSLLKLYPKTRAIYLYASTETFMTSIQIVTNQTREEQYGVMSIVPDVEVKVVDDVGNIVAMGTPGEILVRGVKTFLGYIDDTDMSSRAITAEGWVRTGDSGYFPEYGKLKLLGRLTDVVYKEVEASILHQPTPTILHFSIVKPLTRAANADKRDIDKVLVLLYPREIEEMLERHDGVTRAVVVGGDNSNDTICACVTGMKSRLGGLSEWWDEEFGVSFWKPERFVYLEKMPYAPSLKVDRWAIQRRVFSQ